MRVLHSFVPLAPVVILLTTSAGSVSAQPQGEFELVTGKPFDSAIPKDFYLEGNAIPTQKRNAVLVHTPGKARVVLALIDTTGYSSDITTKYVGMIITEAELSLCGNKIGVGSYGFGWSRPPRGEEGPGRFSLYNQAGASVIECSTSRDNEIKQPRPLQVVPKKDGTALLYYGRHSIEVR